MSVMSVICAPINRDICGVSEAQWTRVLLKFLWFCQQLPRYIKGCGRMVTSRLKKLTSVFNRVPAVHFY